MRLDKYLKVTRIIKRRTVANEACDGGRVSVNGRTVKASYDVKIGDIIEVAFGTKAFRIKVTDIKETTLKSDAQTLYEVIE
ncbi:MAG: RNA-binding S4 domain-containing protein [Ruminococcaceae bacterium]|nr:RNA-binding S4 domain-containing protein [Oscillospiraceae bacterium]